MKKIPILCASVALAFTSLSHAASKGWITNYEEAKKKAAAEKKDILVDFTGSDWCHWCIKLSEEVFDKEEFQKQAPEKFILLELDYPNDKSKQSEELQKQNAELMERFQVQGFPTVLLLDAKGQPYGQTGYAPGGPDAYIKMLTEMRTLRTTRDEKLAAASKLEGLEKAKALANALETINPALFGHYQETIKEITSLDPKDETGFGTMLAIQGLEEKYMKALRGGSTVEALKIVDTFISEHKPEGESLQQALSMKMDPLLGDGKFGEAEAIMAQIIAIDPSTELGKLATDFMPKLKELKAQAMPAPAEPKKEIEKKVEDTTPSQIPGLTPEKK